MKLNKKTLLFLSIALIVLSAFAQADVRALFVSSRAIQKAIGHKYKDIYKEEDRSKLVKFSHAYHQTEVGAECVQCHTSILTSTGSSENNLAKMEACYACHDKKTTDCKYCHVEAKEPYSAFQSPKRELIFSHKQHAGDLNVKCETCHKDVPTKNSAAVGALPAMESCMTCHDGAKASNDCRTCHTDIRFIKPASHAPDFMRTHKQAVATQGTINCVMCHTEESCQECHAGGNLEKIKGKDFNTSFAPSGGNSMMIEQRNHTLDYLFTHRFDAKAKTANCQSCHETESFCSTCHMQSDKVQKPAWHDVAGFVTGSGGIHSKLAKKDMENCISCHQVADQDPTCYQCHTPNGKKR